MLISTVLDTKPVDYDAMTMGSIIDSKLSDLYKRDAMEAQKQKKVASAQLTETTTHPDKPTETTTHADNNKTTTEAGQNTPTPPITVAAGDPNTVTAPSVPED